MCSSGDSLKCPDMETPWKCLKMVTEEQTIEMLIETVRLGRLLVANGAFGETGSCRPVVEVWLMERSSEVRKVSDL